MLTYAIIFIIIGFFLGIIVKPKPAVRLCLYFSIGWAFVQGFWAIATFFELIFGMFLAATFIGKMRNLEENDIISCPHSDTPKQEPAPFIEENKTKQQEIKNSHSYEDYIIEHFSEKDLFLVDIHLLSEEEKYLELSFYILYIEILRNHPKAKECMIETKSCFDLVSHISQLSHLSFDKLLSPQYNALKIYIEELTPKYNYMIENEINENFNDFISAISFILKIYLYDENSAAVFINNEIPFISEESEEGKIFTEDYLESENFLYYVDENRTIKYLDEIQDYLHFILEQIPDLNTRHKAHIIIINYLMKKYDIGTYQEEYLLPDEDDEENTLSSETLDNMTNDELEAYLDNCTILKRPQESQHDDNHNNSDNENMKEKEQEDFDSRYSLNGRKAPAKMSDAEKFFELQYLLAILKSYSNNEDFQQELMKSSITGVSSIKSFAEIDSFNKLLHRISEITEKSLPELLDNDCKGLNKCIKKANSGKAIQKAVKQLLEEKEEKALAGRIAELLNQHIENKAAAKEFVLQELDAASYGDDTAQNFVRQSGFNQKEYKGAMSHGSWDDNDTISHLQKFSRAFTLKIDNPETMCSVNLLIVDYIMKYWKLGKYDNPGNMLFEEMDNTPF